MTDRLIESCKNCRFWGAPLSTGDALQPCRLRAPTAIHLSIEPNARWPDTSSTQWCGEWESVLSERREAPKRRS